MVTERKYRAAIKAKEQAQEIIDTYHREQHNLADARRSEFVGGKPYKPGELIFAAFNRCPCGHGLAYVKNCGSEECWDCSAILLGIADKGIQHTGKLPFAFHRVKGENQPSAGGNTTREPAEPSPEAKRV